MEKRSQPQNTSVPFHYCLSCCCEMSTHRVLQKHTCCSIPIPKQRLLGKVQCDIVDFIQRFGLTCDYIKISKVQDDPDKVLFLVNNLFQHGSSKQQNLQCSSSTQSGTDAIVVIAFSSFATAMKPNLRCFASLLTDGMAKPRKSSKNEDQKNENSGCVVQHQKLCLNIDLEKRLIHGYTELKVAVPPESGVVGLHADCMTIGSVSVDDKLAEFEFFPHYQSVDDERRWSSVSSAVSASDAASSSYLSALDKEVQPNLTIRCGKSSEPSDSNVRTVRIDYWIDKAECGIHIGDNMLHTDSQIRRACCWFPCMDDWSQSCCYDLEFTVAKNLVAVSNGVLLYQVLSKDDPPRKTYVYRLSIPVNARWISLAVAPFEILPDRHNGALSHMCLSPNLAKLRNTVGFFLSAFSHYEDYLSAPFPFGSYKQVFIAPEAVVSSLSLGASISIFSSDVLYDEKVIDQTIDTRIKLAYALARQWFGVYITPYAPNDDWLFEGLAWFLTDSFIKRFLGNNEARYRRYKANCAVCKADVSGATALSSSASSIELYGTQCLGLCGKIRSWKSVAVLQMLEKQMGPESFRKILQSIILRAQDTSRPLRTLSTKEFRHFANKVGNLERPFLKEFFPRWVGCAGCPFLRMGLSYNKRKNIVELAVLRGCTSMPELTTTIPNGNPDIEPRDGDVGWPGMMSIRVYELDGMYDHPILPMAGEAWQLLEIQCHSKLAARRFQKPKKGSKPDGSDDNVEISTTDARPIAESPLLWIRADPEMEYLAEIHFSQPIHMWINQLEKDKDVVAQSQAIATLEALPQPPFSVVTALYNFLTDSKAFWRVRIEAAFALAHTASEDTDYAGLRHLLKFYKSRRFDSNIGLPRPNDFHDFSEYFVLEAIPHAIAMVRATDKKSPREAIEFILQLLKYNDNNGNPYSDVYWLAALIQSIGVLEFGQQSMHFLSSLLKRIDRLLQFDRLMPSYNGILTISCIRTLTQIALKFSASVALDRVCVLITPFCSFKTLWQVRIEASRALIDLEFHSKGIDAALLLVIKFLLEETSLKGEVKLVMHAMRLCKVRSSSELEDEIKTSTLVSLLRLLESRKAFNNVFLRHHLFCILQILGGRPPTLYGVPRVHVQPLVDAETCNEQTTKPASIIKLKIPGAELVADPQNPIIIPDDLSIPEPPKEPDTISNGSERRTTKVKIKLRPSAASSRADGDNTMLVLSRSVQDEADRGASSSLSVNATPRISKVIVNIGNQNAEDGNSSHDHDSRTTVSIGTAKLGKIEGEVRKELECTADSSRNIDLPQPERCPSPKNADGNDGEPEAQIYVHVQGLPGSGEEKHDSSMPPVTDATATALEAERKEKKKKKKKDKDRKRKREEKEEHKGNRDDSDYLEKKRLKKEKKQREKEKTKTQSGNKKTSAVDPQSAKETVEHSAKSSSLQISDVKPLFAEPGIAKTVVSFKPASEEVKPSESAGSKVVLEAVGHKLRIKVKNSGFKQS
ncbi:hypothetical protein Scep_016535 [Stephania cephalantha]|uniref:Transcription initiation factor TFIID subunit 2 n=1 Tax=Stephania cephalantha TaxID=152367 RepID=A0AAP0IPR3_9MAGN